MTSLKQLKPLFTGTGQIILQENAVTGLFFLAGILCGSVVMGLAALTFPFVLAIWITLILKKVIYGAGANQ